MRKYFGIAGIVVAALSMTACLKKDTSHTLYLSPDGAVAWLAIERDVQSDSSDAMARRSEESAFLAAALAGTNDVASGLAALDPLRVQTRVLRRERPFAIVTDARFASAEALANRFLAAFRVPGDAAMSRDGDFVTLRIHLDLRSPASDEDEDTSPVMALVDDLATYRIVLTDGRFTDASGFTLDNGDTVARPIALSDEQAKGVVDLSLTWRQ